MAATAVGVQPSNKLTQLIEKLTGALKTKDGEYHVVVVSIGEGAREGVFVGVGTVVSSYFAAATTLRTAGAFALGFATTTVMFLSPVSQLTSNVPPPHHPMGGFRYAGRPIANIDGAANVAIQGIAAAMMGRESIPHLLMGSGIPLALAWIKDSKDHRKKSIEVASGAVTNVVAQSSAAATLVAPVATYGILTYMYSMLRDKEPERYGVKKIFRTTVISTAAVAGGALAGPVGAIASAIFTGGLFGYFSHKSKS